MRWARTTEGVAAQEQRARGRAGGVAVLQEGSRQVIQQQDAVNAAAERHSEARPPQAADVEAAPPPAAPAAPSAEDRVIAEFEASRSPLAERGAAGVAGSASGSRAAFPEGAQAKADAAGP